MSNNIDIVPDILEVVATIGDATAIDNVREWLQSENAETRTAAALTIFALTRQRPWNPFVLSPRIESNYDDLIIPVLEDAVMELDGVYAVRALKVLVSLGMGDSDTVHLLLNALTLGNDDLRLVAAARLLELDKIEGIDIVLEALGKPPICNEPECVFSKAIIHDWTFSDVFDLVRNKCDLSHRQLIRRLLSAPNSHIKVFGSEMLARIGDHESIPLIVRHLETSDSGYEQCGYLETLGILGDTHIISTILPWIQSDNSYCSQSALKALFTIGFTEEVIVFIKQRLLHIKSGARYYAAAMLAMVGCVEGLRSLITDETLNNSWIVHEFDSKRYGAVGDLVAQRIVTLVNGGPPPIGSSEDIVRREEFFAQWRSWWSKNCHCLVWDSDINRYRIVADNRLHGTSTGCAPFGP